MTRAATPAPASTGSGPLPTAAHLPDDPATLKRLVLELLDTLHQERRDHERVQHQLALLLQRLYGPRGERFRPDQPLLFAELAAAVAEEPAPPSVTETPGRAAAPTPRQAARPTAAAGPPAAHAAALHVDRGGTALCRLRPGPQRDRRGPERTTGV